jgi:hypothetical protein
VSFLALARPIVIEMVPSPDSMDPDDAASAAREIYLHPERYVLIEDRWFILESVAPRSGGPIGSAGPRWQMGPASAANPGGHRSSPPVARVPIAEPPPGLVRQDVAQALAIEGLVQTTGMSRRSAARTCLGWARLEDVSDDQATEAATEAARICALLGVKD